MKLYLNLFSPITITIWLLIVFGCIDKKADRLHYNEIIISDSLTVSELDSLMKYNTKYVESLHAGDTALCLKLMWPDSFEYIRKLEGNNYSSNQIKRIIGIEILNMANKLKAMENQEKIQYSSEMKIGKIGKVLQYNSFKLCLLENITNSKINNENNTYVEKSIAISPNNGKVWYFFNTNNDKEMVNEILNLKLPQNVFEKIEF